MKKVLNTPNGETVMVDTQTDFCLYRWPRKGSYAGTDLFAHKDESGKVYFYARHWSTGQEDGLALWSKECVEGFLLAKLYKVARRGRLTKEEALELSRRYGLRLFDW
jgi:hypothetical protein